MLLFLFFCYIFRKEGHILLREKEYFNPTNKKINTFCLLALSLPSPPFGRLAGSLEKYFNNNK